MSENIIEPKGIVEIPMFSWNTKTKEFYVLGHKFDGINSIEDFINYIHNLDKENQELKEKVEMYENPEDLTLMFMYCTEEAKTKIKKLQQEKEQLREALIIKNNQFKELKNNKTDYTKVNVLEMENTQLKQSLENAQNIYINSHKYTSECEDKVIALKCVLKEIKEHMEERKHHWLGNDLVLKELDDISKMIDKGIGESK